jgi:hypothetical protein
MSIPLPVFPKLTDFIENGAFKALSYFKAVDAWREATEKELRERLEDAKRKEFGVGDWPFEAGRNKASQDIFTEILASIEVKPLSVVPKPSEKGEQ